ncbi:MAG: alpha-ketoglutarate-dependent dioxygenase AlkB [Pseudomonadota bacterium]
MHPANAKAKPEIQLQQEFWSEHAALFDDLKRSVIWDERMRARKTASFGVSYDYSQIAYPEAIMHPSLKEVCAGIAGLLGFKPNNCLLNYYLDGSSSMGFHSDSAEQLSPDTGVAILSLGCAREIQYRSKTDRQNIVSYTLEPGSLLFMSTEVQERWMHSIPKMEGVGERISATFRAVEK